MMKLQKREWRVRAAPLRYSEMHNSRSVCASGRVIGVIDPDHSLFFKLQRFKISTFFSTFGHTPQLSRLR